MKHLLYFILLLFCVSAFAQTPNFNNAISINTTFTNDSVINPFSGDTVTGIGISGDIIFNSDTSFVRMIVDDGSNQFLIYETYPMLEDTNVFSFTYECEESCFFDSYIPTDIILQVSDASLIIDEINWSNIFNS